MPAKRKEMTQLEQAELQLKATRRLLAAKKAHASLIEFVRLMMPDPTDPDDVTLSRYIVAKHHEVLAAALEEVDKGNMPRLIITLPPRHGKSQIASKAFPAWFMGRDPYRQMIVASYSATMAEDFGREVRGYMQTPAYKQVFPLCSLRKGGAASDRVQTEQGGLGVFVGAGGALTGRGADCLTGETLVTTSDGKIPIKRLAVCASTRKVLAYECDTSKLCWRDIKAFGVREADGVYRITTTSGRVVEATGEHPFFNGTSYTQASQLAPGDRLLLGLQKGVDSESLRDHEIREARVDGVLLQQPLRVRGFQCEGGTDRETVQAMRDHHISQGNRLVLQAGVQGRIQSGPIGCDSKEMANRPMQDMREGDADGQSLVYPADMQQKMRSSVACDADAGGEQSGIQARSRSEGVEGNPQSEVLCSCSPTGEESRLSGVCCLRLQGETASPSHQSESEGQPNGESGHSLQDVSHGFSCGGAFQTEADTVAVVERICGKTLVYNLQVEGTENFFANDILTHNCLLIDDPVKDREDADSATMRNKLWSWFTDVAMTRLMGGMGRVVIIMTRWHEDDLVGRLTDSGNQHYNAEEAKQWKIISFPALAEDNDIMGREKDEPLWPDRITKEFLNSQRRLNPRGFSALYQGRPAPEDGDFFKREWMTTYQPNELPKNLRYYCASDHAVSVAQDRDPTVLLPVGVDEQGTIWVLPDVWWRRAQTDDVVDAMLDMMARHKPLIWWAERGHISKSIAPFLRKRMQEEQVYCAIDEVVPVKDKQTRAQSIRGRMSMGKVRFPGFAPWWEAARAQMLSFPAGKHDDFVDTIAYIGMGLGRMTAATAPSRKKASPASGTIGWVLARSKAQQREKANMKACAGF